MTDTLTPHSPITVLVADDSRLTRVSLKSTLFQHREDILFLGEAEEGRQAVTQAERLRPNVILMDVGMPILDGIQATQQIRDRCPEVRVMILTSRESEADVLEAFRSGATSYCMKDCSPETLIQALLSTAGGDSWIDPKIARIVLQHSLREKPQLRPSVQTEVSETNEPQALLTERESDVLRCITHGQNNTQIATQLCISQNTVKTHLKNIFTKLGVEDRTTAALKALKERMI